MKTNTLLIAGYYGFGNAGDELILSSLIEQVRRESPGWTLVVMSSRPEQTRRLYTVKAVDRWRPWEWIVPLLRARRFWLGGGGLLQETTGPWNYVYYLGLVILAKLFGCRTELRAIGVDPIKRGANRALTRLTFNHFVDHVSVRDDDSQRALEAAGVRRTIYQMPDPVFQLPARRAAAIQDRIALALAPWSRRPGWDHDVALLIDRIRNELQVPVDLVVFYPNQDDPVSRQVASLVRSPLTVKTWDRPDELLDWISSYALVVGMRFHALAIAALHQRPFVGWGFQKKVHTLCRDFGQPVWSFERGWDEESVFRQIRESWRQRESLALRYQATLRDTLTSIPRQKDVLKIHPVLL